MWREIAGEISVLVIHRTVHKDVSLPKGKVDPGEILPQTAVREIREETGIKVALGVPLGVSRYPMPNGKNKEVHYWAAKAREKAIAKSTFSPNDEVEALTWLPLAEARQALTYDPDREILDAFSALIARDIRKTFALVILRHATAVAPGMWVGADNLRPLAPRGYEQAKQLARRIPAWRPKTLITSNALRCRETVEPLAIKLERFARPTAKLSQDAFYGDHDDIRAIVRKLLKRKKSAVVCSHGPVIPEIMREIALLSDTPLSNIPRESTLLQTASYTVVHLSADKPDHGILTIETFDTP